MLLQFKTSKVYTPTKGRRSGCFAVRAVGNALHPQISVINVVSSRIRRRSVVKEKLLRTLARVNDLNTVMY